MAYVKVLRKRQKVVDGIFVEDQPLIVEEGYEVDEIKKEVIRAGKKTLYHGKVKYATHKPEKLQHSEPKTYTRREIMIVELKEKYGDRGQLRKEDIFDLYYQIGQTYNPGQSVPKTDIYKMVSEIYGRKIHATNLAKQLRICADEGIVTILKNKKLMSFTGKPKAPSFVAEVKPEPVAAKKKSEFKVVFDHEYLELKVKDAEITARFKNFEGLKTALSLANKICEMFLPSGAWDITKVPDFSKWYRPMEDQKNNEEKQIHDDNT